MYKSKIKKIGNSWYVKIPPKLHKNMELRDNEEVIVDKFGNRIEIMFKKDYEINKEVLKDLEEGVSLGPPIKVTRDELYESHRY